MIRFRKIPRTNSQCAFATDYCDDIGELNKVKKRTYRFYLIFRLKDDRITKPSVINEYPPEDTVDESFKICGYEESINDCWDLLGILPSKQTIGYIGENEYFELTEEEAEQIIQNIINYAQERLIKFLTYRERAVSECVSFLQRLPLNKDFADDIIKKALDWNYVNDNRFAELLSQSCISRNMSFFNAKAALIKKRIDSQIIEDVLAKFYNRENNDNVIQYNVDKAIKKYPDQTSYKDYQKCIAYLINKSFHYDDFINKVREYYSFC